MEENKDVKQEKATVKKETAKKTTGGTTKKATTRKTSTTATKKTPAKTINKKQTTGTAKKAVSGTARKTTTTAGKVTEEQKVAIKVEEKVEPKKVENIDKVEEKKTTEVKKEEKPKFEPAVKIEKKKSKHPFLKTILVLIIMAIILFLIHFARNYVIIDSILARQEALQDITNYSCVIRIEGNTLEYYRKDNTMTLVNNKDNTKVLIWINKDRNETIFIDMLNLTATVQEGENFEAFSSASTGLIFTEEPHTCDYEYWITSETVNGKDCYKITWITVNQSAWYDKESGALMKVDTNDGQLVTEYTDWKYNELTDDDMARPNLMGYEVKEVQKDNNQ